MIILKSLSLLLLRSSTCLARNISTYFISIVIVETLTDYSKESSISKDKSAITRKSGGNKSNNKESASTKPLNWKHQDKRDRKSKYKCYFSDDLPWMRDYPKRKALNVMTTKL